MDCYITLFSPSDITALHRIEIDKNGEGEEIGTFYIYDPELSVYCLMENS